MKKAYGIKLYLRYLWRYWYVLIASIVVCAIALMGYALFTRPAAAPAYEGSVTILGMGAFWGSEELNNLSEVQVATYESMRADALVNMQSTQVRKDTYRQLRGAWAAFKKSKSNKDLESLFMASLSVTADGSSSVHAVFRDHEGDASAAFTEQVVETYLKIAKETAVRLEPYLSDGATERLLVSEVVESVDSNTSDSAGVIRNTVFGGIGGMALGLLIVLLMYVFDRRIHAYEDIADGTGHRLLGTMASLSDEAVLPQIDRAVGSDCAVSVIGDGACAARVASGYAAYARQAGYRTLVLDFAAGDDTLDAVLNGDEAALEADAPVLGVGKSRARLGKERQKFADLRAQYDRIVLAVPYTGDGSAAIAVSVADCVVYAIDPAVMRLRDVAEMANEAQAGQKAAGAVLGSLGGAFVGDTIFGDAEAALE